MGFQKIGKIENSKFYVDIAIRSANENAGKLKDKIPVKDPFLKKKKIEVFRIEHTDKVFQKQLQSVIKAFPRFETLPPFFFELAKVSLKYDETIQALKELDIIGRKVGELSSKYIDRIGHMDVEKYIEESKRAYLPRLHQTAKKLDPALKQLEESRRIMREYPVIKTSMPTVCIAGFPNVGKTTLMYKLTGSRPEIKSYAFTTKTLNTAYCEQDDQKIQFIDTPGTLNRLDKMNNIERQAYLAIKFLANAIIYVFDITEPYTLEEQKKLYKSLEQFDKPIIVYASKTDLTTEKLPLISEYSPVTSPSELIQKILEIIK